MTVCLSAEVPMSTARLPGIFPARPEARSGRHRLFPNQRGRIQAGVLLFGLGFAAAFGCLAQDGQPVASQTAVKPAVEAKLQSEGAARGASQKGEEAVSARKKQISDESSQLLAMALSLKSEVDKTSKDTLSLKVIRKADEIERLAKTVKEKIKQGAGASQ
jgi:hypothetical protein